MNEILRLSLQPCHGFIHGLGETQTYFVDFPGENREFTTVLVELLIITVMTNWWEFENAATTKKTNFGTEGHESVSLGESKKGFSAEVGALRPFFLPTLSTTRPSWEQSSIIITKRMKIIAWPLLKPSPWTSSVVTYIVFPPVFHQNHEIKNKSTQFYMNIRIVFPPKNPHDVSIHVIRGFSQLVSPSAGPGHCSYLQELEKGPFGFPLGCGYLWTQHSILHPCPLPGQAPGAPSPLQSPTSAPLPQLFYNSLVDPDFNEFPVNGIQTNFSGEGSV